MLLKLENRETAGRVWVMADTATSDELMLSSDSGSMCRENSVSKMCYGS